MQATITQVRGRSRSLDKTVVYVNSNLVDMIDKDIFTPLVTPLQVKSKGWDFICRQVNKIICSAIKDLFKSDYKVSFSHKAGCSCGCSPGYRVKRHGLFNQPSLENESMWIDVTLSEEELLSFKTRTYFKCKDLIYKDARIDEAKKRELAKQELAVAASA